MNTNSKVDSDNLSTPKRRRLGLRRSKPAQTVNKNKKVESTPINELCNNIDIRESSPLPCNQELLRDSSSNCTITSEIPGSPADFEMCSLKNIKNWDSFILPKKSENSQLNCTVELNKTPITKLDTRFAEKHDNTLTSRNDKLFRDEIEESFDMLNQSIININKNNNDRSSFFKTQDLSLLDIRESGIINNNELKSVLPETNQLYIEPNSFYGLPLIVRGLFKSYRNIEKFYDWQEECLSLNTIMQRRNLIYALPTSGGKTLVAEVLMLREVLNRKKNALFILPFVAIVQEKIWSLAPFALQLEFLVEEYAAGKGHIPPKKRRKKNSIYIATIEKGLALIRSLIELDRLDELGLIVVDELHLIGESGRGSTLEMLLTTVIFANKGIQIVGMSATIGNLPDIAKFLKADIYEKQFRPVELTEYVKLGNMLHKIVWGPDGMEIIPDRELVYDYSPAGLALDPDMLGGLVSDVCPGGSCLVFCPTKRNCENVASLLCKVQRKEMSQHRAQERRALAGALRGEGAGAELAACALRGVAFHHAGLAADERALLETAFRSGVISVICCTSTLAAGVNLPARRVIIRAPLIGREPLALGAYKQMVGRAGRAGVCEAGESILICSGSAWERARVTLAGALPPARSALRPAAPALLLSAAALRLAPAARDLRRLLRATLLAVHGSVDMDQVYDESIQILLNSEALEIVGGRTADNIDDDTEFAVSNLGNAAIKGCIELSVAKRLLEDLDVASQSVVLIDSLHLLYLVTPHDTGIKPDYWHYYSLYSKLDEEGVQTAKTLGITEVYAIRMMTGKPITNVPESVLCRFYLALMLRDLWRQIPFRVVAEKYLVSRGALQTAMSSAAAFASSAHRLCAALPARWPFCALLEPLAARLQHCAAPGLEKLLELPAVKKARAMQLLRAGYKSVEDIAKASVDDLTGAVNHLSRTAADHLISSARMMLIEKVENLRAEAEDVMEDLKL